MRCSVTWSSTSPDLARQSGGAGGHSRPGLRIPDQEVRRRSRTRRRASSTRRARRAPDGEHPRPAAKARPSTTPRAAPAACCSRPSTTSGSSDGDDRTLWGKLFGQEKNLTTSAIARMNLFLHGVEDFQVVRGDTLREPGVLPRATTWPRSTASSPIRRSRWRSGARRCGPATRTGATSPACRPTKSGDYAWVQHMIKSMAPKTGRMAVVLPHGALFRMGAEGKIRQKLLEHGPARSRHRPGSEPVLRHRPGRLHPRASPAQGDGAQEEGAHHRRLPRVQDAAGRRTNSRPSTSSASTAGTRDYTDVEGIARVVTLDEIAANDCNLNIAALHRADCTTQTHHR